MCGCEANRAFNGHVYDLSTVGGWFLANGLVIHNSTIDTRTRPTHRAADFPTPITGQRVPVGTPFLVGGFWLDQPGDPEGPPQETISRCGTVFSPGENTDLSDRQMVR
jgi:hypothetical protein